MDIREQGRPAENGKAVDVALAEYNALRSETVAHLNSQAALTGIGLTALGLILGASFGEKGDKDLLALVAPLSLVVSLLTIANYARLVFLGWYIRDELWPFLADEVTPSTRKLPTWEGYGAKYRARNKARSVLDFFLQGPTIGLFVVASTLATVTVQAQISEATIIADWVCVGLSVIVPLGFGVSNWKYERGEPLVPTDACHGEVKRA